MYDEERDDTGVPEKEYGKEDGPDIFKVPSVSKDLIPEEGKDALNTAKNEKMDAAKKPLFRDSVSDNQATQKTTNEAFQDESLSLNDEQDDAPVEDDTQVIKDSLSNGKSKADATAFDKELDVSFEDLPVVKEDEEPDENAIKKEIHAAFQDTPIVNEDDELYVEDEDVEPSAAEDIIRKAMEELNKPDDELFKPDDE